MPRVFDNIDRNLLPVLQETIQVSDRADFYVGYFNLRRWNRLDSLIEEWSGGEDPSCRLLVGMPFGPREEIRQIRKANPDGIGSDTRTAARLRKKIAEDFCEQLSTGVPSNEDEACLRKLAAQIRANKVRAKV